MTSQQNENTATTAPRRKSSILAALTLNCNLPTVPIINEPQGVTTAATEAFTTATTSTPTEVKKKSLRFDTNALTTHEYDSEEIKETKRRIKDEIRRWVMLNPRGLNVSFHSIAYVWWKTGKYWSIEVFMEN